jgi:uncharacterized repeat protein (TIGR01451 family)
MRIQSIVGGTFLVLVITVLLASPSADSLVRAAAPLYVAPGGNDSNSCTSPAAPCATINGAIGKAGSGDTIYLASGSYTGTGTEVVFVDKSVLLSGGWDSAFTTQGGVSIVDGEGTRQGVLVNSGTIAAIEHVAVQNCLGWGCSGISNYGSLAVTSSVFRKNASTLTGGGICNNSGGVLVLTSSLVEDNWARISGGGIFNRGTLTINNSAVRRNSATDPTGPGGAGIGSEGSLTLNNTTVSGNSSNCAGGGIWTTSSLMVNNSTVSNNSGSSVAGGYVDCSGGGIHMNGGTVTLQNTILAGNTAATGPDCSRDIGSAGYNIVGDTSGCSFAPSTGDRTNLDAHLGQLIGVPGTPMYHPLLLGSPAIDAGTPTGCMGNSGPLTTDQRGVARVGRCDIGAYEYTIPGLATAVYALRGTPQRAVPGATFATPLQAEVLDAAGSPVEGVAVTFTAPTSGPGGTFPDTGTATMATSTDEAGIATADFRANSLSGSYTVAATASGVLTPASFLLTNVAWYVATDGNDGNNCIGPATPCATINGALDKPGFTAEDTVFVAAGTYTGSGDQVVLLDKSATFSGGWSNTFTTRTSASVIDGETVRRGVVVNGDQVAVLERFVIQRGHAEDLGGGIRNEGTLTLNHCDVTNNTVEGALNPAGAGIFNSGSLTLNHCSVSGNTGRRGAGIYSHYGPVVVNESSISANAAELGGGISTFDASLVLNNCTISSNTAIAAAGIEAKGTLALHNTTITGNHASESGGGIASQDASTTLQNTILYGNRASSGLDCSGGTVVSLGYNLVGDMTGCSFTPAAGDLTGVNPRLGPLFLPPGIPAYHPLMEDSPAIDAGNPAGCTDHHGNLLATDQRGAPRAGRCDIGAYEYTIPGPPAMIMNLGGTDQRTAPSIFFDLPFKVLVLDAVGTAVVEEDVTFAGPLTGAGGTFADTRTYSTTVPTDPNGIAVAPPWKANGTTGSYLVTAEVHGIAEPAEFSLTNSPAWYVATSGSDGNSCRSTSRPCVAINGALAKPDFASGDTVLVGAGRYTGTGDQVVMLWKNARLLGGWNPAFTIQTGLSVLDGQDVRQGVTVEDGVSAVVERFSIEHGKSAWQGYGGGVLNAGTLTLRGSVIKNNRAGMYGGGIFNGGTLVLRDAAVKDNISGQAAGGAIMSEGPSLAIVNSTITGNKADDCGPFCGSPLAVVTAGATHVANSTIVANQGGGLAAGAYTVVQNSILLGNPAGDCGGPVHSLGHNLVRSSGGCPVDSALGDVVTTQPKIAPVEDFFALLPGSPAINAGNPDGCRDDLGNPLWADQRGKPRAGRCDIGAYEVQPLEFSAKTASPVRVGPGKAVTYTIALENVEVFEVSNARVTDTLPISLTYTAGSLSATSGSAGFSSGVITWTGTVDAGKAVTVTFGAMAGAKTGQIANRAVIAGPGEVFTRTATIEVRLPIFLPVVLR